MSAKDLSEEEDDDDYCPTKNAKEQSDSSSDSENDVVDEVVSKTDLNVAPYDESKTDELWKSFSSTSDKPTAKVEPPPNATPVNRVFEYAGEKVSVPMTASPSLKRPTAASGSVLDRLGIGKKQKLSTLEKSRLDWDAHKQSEALNEDLDSHRRGKDSYVEKKAFLERTELREHDHYLSHAKKK